MTDLCGHAQQDTDSGDTRQPVFATTHWSVVLAVGATPTTRAQQALSRLCQSYWYPLYAYVRRRGWNPQDAEDLTQEFFARLLRKDSLSRVSREGGRFRSFLLKSLTRFLTDEWRRARVQKRGAGKVISLDAASAESLFQIETAETHPPEALYDRNWALTLLGGTFKRLREEYHQNGKGSLFDELKFCLTGERSAIPYIELAGSLKLPESTLKTLVHRLRKRYRELLREEVAQTVNSAEEIEEELRALFRALA
jgi:RNA polymerase sigma-70 factor (ECF subfamily)